MEVKCPTDYKQQVELLKLKGFIIDDELECIEFLRRSNYYRVSAYFIPFRYFDKSGNKHYQENISFKQICNIYEFDSKLRTILFPVIEEIESFLRSQLSYFHAHKYGALGYLDASLYNKKHRHDVFLRIINEIIYNNKDTHVVRHHKTKYEEKFPLWVIIDYFSTGQLAYFYKDMLEKDKGNFAKTLFTIRYDTLDSWFRCFTDLRNKCAHFTRLYYWSFSAIPKTPELLPHKMERTLFDQIYMLKFLYTNKEKWDTHFLADISSLFENYESDIVLSHIGFPEDWKFQLHNLK